MLEQKNRTEQRMQSEQRYSQLFPTGSRDGRCQNAAQKRRRQQDQNQKHRQEVPYFESRFLTMRERPFRPLSFALLNF